MGRLAEEGHLVPVSINVASWLALICAGVAAMACGIDAALRQRCPPSRDDVGATDE